MRKSFTLLLVLAFVFSIFTSFSGSPRAKVVEEFTNASCPPCAALNPAFFDFLNENMSDYITIVYRTWWPGSDIFYNQHKPMYDPRIAYYSVNAVPQFFMNGDGPYQPTPNNVMALAQNYEGEISPITIDIDETRNGTNVSFTVTVSSDEAVNGKILRIVAIEQHHYANNAGTNGEKDFYYLARQMFPNVNGQSISVPAGGSIEKSYDYTIQPGWNTDKMYVVAFVQDDNTKEILQGGTSLEPISVEMSVDNPYNEIDPNSQVKQTVTLTNETDNAITTKVSIDTDNSNIPQGWSATVSPETVYVPANSTATTDVTIRSNGNAAFAVTVIKNDPQSGGLVSSKDAEVYALATNTKYAIWYGANGNIGLFINEMLSHPKYGGETAYMPMNTALYDNYDTQAFDVSFYSFDGFSPFWIGTDGTVQQAVRDDIQNRINAGKDVYISSEVDLTIAHDQNGGANARAFFTNVLGVEPVGIYTLHEQTNGQITGLRYTTVGGVANDPISSSWNDFTINQNYNQQTHPYFILYGQAMKVAAGSNAVPFIQYATSGNEAAAVRLEKGDARVVFLGFGIEAIGNQGTRTSVFNSIMNWLTAAPAQTAPEIALTKTSLDFGKIKIDEEKEMSFQIRNEGDAKLVVNAIELQDLNLVFELADLPSFPITIDPAEPYTIKVKFSPIAEAVFDGKVTITSNDSDESSLEVTLKGEGEKLINSVEPGVAGDENVLTISAGPNPFAELTTITYNVGSKAGSSINIYLIDASGRTVETIISNGTPVSGTAEFNAGLLPSGAYFIVGETNGYRTQLPVVINK